MHANSQVNMVSAERDRIITSPPERYMHVNIYSPGDRVRITSKRRVTGPGLTIRHTRKGRVVWAGPRFIVVEFRGACGWYREAFLTFRAAVNDEIQLLEKEGEEDKR